MIPRLPHHPTMVMVAEPLASLDRLQYGGCLCEAVKYQVQGPPSLRYLCHCRNCQRATGSTFQANCFFARAGFDVTQGKDKLSVFQFKGTGSGSDQRRHFCTLCGTPLFIFPGNKEEIVVVYAGTLDDFNDDFVPTQECWVKQRRSWVSGVEGAECFQESRPLASGRPHATQ